MFKKKMAVSKKTPEHGKVHNDFRKELKSSETSGSIFTDSIVRSDAEYTNKPLKASDVLTSGEIEMLQKLFSTLRANIGVHGYK